MRFLTGSRVISVLPSMTRGDQRDRARERNAKQAKERGGGGNQEGLSAAQRRERDAAIMKQKQEAAQAKRQDGPGGGTK